MSYKYLSTDCINGEPNGLVYFSLKAWFAICDTGHSWRNWLPFESTDSAVYCMQEDSICGVLVYHKLPQHKKIIVEIAYVDPNHRGAGIYDTMYDLLYDILKDQPYHVIESLVHPTNKRMMEKIEKHDRDISFYTVRKKIN